MPVISPTEHQRSETLAAHASVPSHGGASQGPSAPQRAAEQFAKRVVARAGCGLNRMLGSRAGDRFGILMYHRVADHVPGIEAPTWNVTPAVFRAQMVGLLDRGFQAWPLKRLIESHRQGSPVPPKTFAVTFDDGQVSVYRHAYPILKELGIPATLFLPTAYIDGAQPFPFDDWPAAGRAAVGVETWRPMTSAECRAISADGLVELGAHTHTHQDFYRREDEFAGDLTTNVKELEARFDVRDASFAFPFGRATPGMMDRVREIGLCCGLTTAAVLVDPSRDPFGWGRFNVEAWDTAATLAAKLSGWCSWARTIRRRLVKWRRPELISG
jgi:peptidoglycan/xylan/chitin deacetylase (PgdA/CDA1 family)